MTPANPLAATALIATGGLAGLLGVGLAAMGAHGPASGTTLTTAASFLMFHAPVLLVLGVAARLGGIRPRVAVLAGGLIGLGLLLFSGDLALRALLARALFPMAAPTGGVALMVGWAVVVAGAIVRPRGSTKNSG